MKKRRAVRAAGHTGEQRDGGVSGEHYRAGYEAGYALGLRLGQEDRGSVFEGTSIIIPADSQHDAAVQVIQHIETMTPHLYEVLVADAGATANTRRYIHDRRGVVRHIKGNSGDHLAAVVNKAISASLGEYIVILANDPPHMDNWLGVLMCEFEREPGVKMVYASSAVSDLGAALVDEEKSALPSSSSSPLSCLLFRRSLPAEIGMWTEEILSAEDHMHRWLERIPAEQRLQIEASPLFASGKI
ncbi:hypothetical protein AK95_18775 [Paenibacillus sp. LC231]|uniref:glycosyltransferase family A protein n=1 Tax=Paenibacillus sp. LC231 TaxID=1120679 RepID=UPI0008DD835A|nr:glycosyltransferase family A protein [Paenibacillus sp. LC231]OIA99221.1 hypothetical protein AK95_18775 [Paenibacillus sp. LC231]